MKRQFTTGAPNRLWVADITYVATWAGTVYVAFVYSSTSNAAARWTVDDVVLTNSATPAPPTVRLSISLVPRER